MNLVDFIESYSSISKEHILKQYFYDYKEIERLKELNKSYNNLLNYWKNQYSDLMERNFKAIDYLSEMRRTSFYELDKKIDNLEDILLGNVK